VKRFEIILAVSLALILVGLRMLEYRYYNYGEMFNWYIASSVAVALAIGWWLGREFFTKRKVKAESNKVLNPEALLESGLSKREVEILILIEKGQTNQEIADSLFVSLNTVKTHNANIFQKLDVKNRVQAIAKGRSL
jgi:DNA-binding NarL/FixJ family response regulator